MGNWKPFNTAPKQGSFLVYLPNERRKVEVMHCINETLSIVGGAFSFDISTPTLWHPLPDFPKEPS